MGPKIDALSTKFGPGNENVDFLKTSVSPWQKHDFQGFQALKAHEKTIRDEFKIIVKKWTEGKEGKAREGILKTMKIWVQNEGLEGKGREVEKSQKKGGIGESVSEGKGFTSQIGGDSPWPRLAEFLAPCSPSPPQTIAIIKHNFWTRF